MNREEVIEKLRELKPYLAEKYHICEIGLFGSYARGDYDENSDIDILVKYSKITPLWDLVETIADLERYLTKKIDIAEKKNLKELLKDNILKEVIYI